MAMVPKLNTMHFDKETPFQVVAPFEPMGDQPQAIEELAAGCLLYTSSRSSVCRRNSSTSSSRADIQEGFAWQGLYSRTSTARC